MSDPIQVAISKVVTDTAASVDQYLLSFFGSEENVKEFGRYYILESKESEFTTEPDDANNAFRIQMCNEYRLRLKTREELEMM